MDKPSRLASVRVEGAAHTRSSFLGWLIAPHLTKVSGADPATLGNALHATRGIAHTLLATDIFAAVEPRLEASRDVFAKDGDVDLVLKTRERGRFFLKGGTEVGSGEGSAVRLSQLGVLLCPACSLVLPRPQRPVCGTYLAGRRPSRRTFLRARRPGVRSRRRLRPRSHPTCVRAASWRCSGSSGITQALRAHPRRCMAFGRRSG